MTDFGERRRVLPKTGQTTSYRDGDDGYYQKGWRDGERFKDVGDGTIIDNATGLMWPKDWAGPGANNGNKANWNNCIDYAQALDFVGYDDWRLPNITELWSLINCSLFNPATPPVFINVIANFYNTSTTYANILTTAWLINIYQGATRVSPKANTRYLVCVRDA